MNSQALKQNAVYLSVAFLVFLILYLIAPTKDFKPKGIILPTVKQKLVPSNAPVMVYQNAPYASKQVADINLEGHSLKPNKSQEKIMLATAKKMAQKAGADGLVITAFGYEGASANNPAPLAKYVLFAKAIKLN